MKPTTALEAFLNDTDFSDLNGTGNGSELVRPVRAGCPFTRAEFIGYFMVQPVICVVGFVLNMINFFVFLRGKQFAGSATYRFMMVLSLFDALTLLLTFPQSFVRCKNYLVNCDSKAFKTLRFAIFRWQIYNGIFLVNSCEGVSVWMTVLLSVERYLSIKHHYIIKAYFTPTNVRKIILFIVGVCLLVNIPLCFVQVLETSYKNVTVAVDDASLNFTANSTEHSLNLTTVGETYRLRPVLMARLGTFGRSDLYRAYSWMRIIVFNFVPLIFLSCINVFLIYVVRSSGHFRKHSSQTRSGEKRMKAQRNLTILLVTVIFLFLAGQIPLAFAFVQVFSVVSNCKAYIDSCCQFHKIYRMVTILICLVTYATNFFIYQALNKHFRAEIYRLCRLFQTRGHGNNTSEVIGAEGIEMITRRNQGVNSPKSVHQLVVGNGDVDKEEPSAM